MQVLAPNSLLQMLSLSALFIQGPFLLSSRLLGRKLACVQGRELPIQRFTLGNLADILKAVVCGLEL